MSISSPSFSSLSPIPTGTQRKSYHIHGIDISVIDYRGSDTGKTVTWEIESNTYNFGAIPFEPGDVVLDLGGHVGIVSIYLAKRYPFLKIYAYEPAPGNHKHFLLNLSDNKIQNVQLFNKAVTEDGRFLNLAGDFRQNSGGATCQLQDLSLPGWSGFSAESTTLEVIFTDHGIERCKLLKVDIEGSEYEVLLTSACLDRVEYFIGEFHSNRYLVGKGYSVEGLYRYLKQFIAIEKIGFTTVHMSE